MKNVELKEPIKKMLVGMDIAADAVVGTLGPKGRNAFIDDPMQPIISNDGKRIADSITLPDKLENMGAWVVKNTAAQTNDDAGDGTTTTVALLQSITHEAIKRPENPMEVSNSLLEASKTVVKAIKDKSKKLDAKDIYQVAITSTEHEELAKVISEVVGKVGAEGTVLVEENSEPKLDYVIVEGYEANAGFISPYFINSDKKPEAMFEKVRVLVSEKKISTVGDIQPLFARLKEHSVRQLVIVCEEIDPAILGVFIQNKMQGIFSLLVVKATGPLLQDIAAAVGATIVSDSTGVTFENIQVDEHLGLASKVVSTEKKTVFVASAKSAKDKADQLEQFAKNNPNKWESKKAMERVAKLRGGMAVIRVGAPTTLAMGYLKDKAEDAVRATQAALEEGIVEGGGMTLWRIARELKGKTPGEEILKRALTTPLRKICENAGKEYTEVTSKLYHIVDMDAGDKEYDSGYNAKDNTYVDMFAEGIVDPAKVERCAVINAVNNAAKFITAHVAIVDYVEPK